MTVRIYQILSVLIFAHGTTSKPYHVSDNSLEAEKLSLLKNPDIKTIIPGKKNVFSDPVLLRDLPKVFNRKERRDRFEDIKSFDEKININRLQHNENSVVINNPPRLPKAKNYRHAFKHGDVKYDRHASHLHSSSHSYESHSDEHDYNIYNDQEESQSRPFIDLTRIETKQRHKKEEPNLFGNLVKTNDLINTDRIDFTSLRSDVIDSVKSFLDPSKLRAIDLDLPFIQYALRRNGVKEKDLQHILRGGSQTSDESESASKTSEEEENISDTKKASSESNSDESDYTPKRFKVKKNKSKHEKAKKHIYVSKQKRQPVFESADESIEFQQPVISTETDEFNESGELSTEAPKKKRKKNVYHTKKEIYIQSPRRLVKVGPDLEDLRKRMQHFLPKRYHWNEDEFQNLGYFWFNGPQGRDPPGPWRITY